MVWTSLELKYEWFKVAVWVIMHQSAGGWSALVWVQKSCFSLREACCLWSCSVERNQNNNLCFLFLFRYIWSYLLMLGVDCAVWLWMPSLFSYLRIAVTCQEIALPLAQCILGKVPVPRWPLNKISGKENGWMEILCGPAYMLTC